MALLHNPIMGLYLVELIWVDPTILQINLAKFKSALKDLLETPGLVVVFKYYSVCLFVF